MDSVGTTELQEISYWYQTNYVGIASFTILIWDHVDTFTAEVEYIWKGRRGLIVWLFLLNRYLMPLGFIVNLYAYLSDSWTPERCSRFVRYEGSMTMIGIGVVGLMMFLRIYALYRRQPWIYRAVGLLLLIQAATNAWLLTKGQAVRHNAGSYVKACTMIFDPKLSAIASASAWLPLLYDTAIFSLTLNRALPSLRQRHASFVMVRLFEDGLIYYSAIFAVTLVLTIMIVVAPPGLKNITAQLELLLTVTMMSRITLNLKKSAGKETGQDMRARNWRSQQEPAEPILFSVPEVYRTGPGMSPIIFGNQSQVSSTVSVASDNTGYELRKNVQR